MLNHFLVSYSDQPYSKVREKSSMCSKIIECTFSISHSICSQLCMLMCSSMYSLLFHSQFDIACLSYRHERDRICSRIENISCYNRDWLHRTTGQRHRQTKRIRIDFNFFRSLARTPFLARAYPFAIARHSRSLSIWSMLLSHMQSQPNTDCTCMSSLGCSQCARCVSIGFVSLCSFLLFLPLWHENAIVRVCRKFCRKFSF